MNLSATRSRARADVVDFAILVLPFIHRHENCSARSDYCGRRELDMDFTGDAARHHPRNAHRFRGQPNNTPGHSALREEVISSSMTCRMT